MDPRYKLEWYKATGWNRGWIESCRKIITNLWNSRYKPVGSGGESGPSLIPQGADQSQEEGINFEAMFQIQMQKIRKSTQDDELKRYLSETVVGPEVLDRDKSGIDGALGWWKVSVWLHILIITGRRFTNRLKCTWPSFLDSRKGVSEPCKNGERLSSCIRDRSTGRTAFLFRITSSGTNTAEYVPKYHQTMPLSEALVAK
jgi:hypothetical protein